MTQHIEVAKRIADDWALAGCEDPCAMDIVAALAAAEGRGRSEERELERDDADACLREVIRHARNEGNAYREDEFGAPYVINTRAESAEARIAELEKRLADAERVIEPFAASARSDKAVRLCLGEDIDDWAADGFGITLGHLRAARAYMEGK